MRATKEATDRFTYPNRGRRFGLIAYVLRVAEIRKQRMALQELPPWLLKDIGVSRQDARREAERSFWDIG